MALPGILADIAALVGEDAALLVARAGGGRRVYIPKSAYLKPGHWLVDAVGMDKASVIADAIGGGELDMPQGPVGSRARTHEAIHRALDNGMSVTAIVRLTGVDDSTVWRHKARRRNRGSGGGDQGSLL